MLISHRQAHWQVGEKRFVDPASGAVVTETYWIPGGQSVGGQHASRAVGAGVFAGGGNVGGRRGVTVARDADIVSLGVPRCRRRRWRWRR
ncbi:MAG: hypothetical protein M5U09_05120 [Gammaproteobacteria bacterium]|nr:hypothetical protein [Gammaproteobacteria bacterium]